MQPLTVGVLGCGTISAAYIENAVQFDSYNIVACADLDPERTTATADEYGLTGYEPDELLATDDVELVVNLTPPAVHAGTCKQILDAGKHVYVEKPLAVSHDEAVSIRDQAEAAGLRLGGAPDTFLGTGLQTCRSVIDDGHIGEPVGATAVWVSGGHESWHANPDLFYREGGGPLFDMGPYYVTALVSLLGPASRVTGSVSQTTTERTITSEPRHGETIPVEVPTHETGIVDFERGATATLTTSFDGAGRSTFPTPAFEIYGTGGTLQLPDPNQFTGRVAIQRDGEETETVEPTHDHAVGRGLGVADMARAIRNDGDHRANGRLACHVLEILSGIRAASESGEHVELDSTLDRPEPVSPSFVD
ncbi:Gfo/Idh/MocA family protein [Haloarchaeobius sp. DFWS5]|uniref:Gfo/Idh/MocA family protein n=1 Tax=Haloarchaeobius sp. DFWS5 TaxID=3446114 RepID=UPI003EB91E59